MDGDKTLQTYIYRKPKIHKRFEDGYIVREMTFEDTRIVLNWWCGTLIISPYDLRIAHSVFPDRDGFMVGELNGSMVSSICSVSWGGQSSFFHFYYVEEKHRGSKFGRRLLFTNKNLAFSKKLFRCEAVKEMEEWYKTALDMKNSSFSTIRYQGTAKLHDERKYKDGFVVKAADVDFEKILEYDNKRFVVANCPARKAFLKQWLNVAGGQAVVILDKSNCVVGYGQRRPCYQEKYHEIGPLYADNEHIARCIFKELCYDIAGESVVINIWSRNEESVKMMDDFELKEEFSVPRLFHANVAQDHEDEYKDTTFAVTSLVVCSF